MHRTRSTADRPGGDGGTAPGSGGRARADTFDRAQSRPLPGGHRGREEEKDAKQHERKEQHKDPLAGVDLGFGAGHGFDAFRAGPGMRAGDAEAARRIDVGHPDGKGHSTASGSSGTYFGMPVTSDQQRM